MTSTQSTLHDLRTKGGEILAELRCRGWEFIPALYLLVNGRAALFTRPDGTPLAPYLASALVLLHHTPSQWAVVLCSVGVVEMLYLLLTIHREGVAGRCCMTALMVLFYIAITVAARATPPPQGSERYEAGAICSLFAFTCLSSQWLKDWRESRGNRRENAPYPEQMPYSVAGGERRA